MYEDMQDIYVCKIYMYAKNRRLDIKNLPWCSNCTRSVYDDLAGTQTLHQFVRRRFLALPFA